ncbi:MAG: glycosyltransferase family 4 protein [Blastocatellia bacterium]|nr:glycosyltransferase family 4 protein [Blastocatellia bacterium]
MVRVLLNALAATAGGGVTYLKNVLPRLSVLKNNNRFFVLVPPDRQSDYARLAGPDVSIETIHHGAGLFGRFFWEQTGLRSYIKSRKIDALVSLGNFALFASPVPQILFNRNDLYFSRFFADDLKVRGLYSALIRHRLKSLLARASVKEADLNLAPTKAFVDRISGGKARGGAKSSRFRVLPFGFDWAGFTAGGEPLPREQVGKIDLSENCYRILYVSHYNYFRNFETLIRALPIIREKIREQEGKEIQLILTTDIRRGAVYGGYDSTQTASLIARLDLNGSIAMLGSVPYERLHRLYRLCDLCVCPSYAESFSHPLVEAMAMGVPVAAANLDVHREVCGEAAAYFDVFNEMQLAMRCVEVLTNRRLQEELRMKGAERIRHFSWDEHIQGLLALIEILLVNRRREHC